MSAETIPAEVATDLDCIRKRLTDRATRPAEPAATVDEAGEVVAWGVEMYGFWELCNDEETARYRHEPARKVEPLVRLSSLEAERARADRLEQERDCQYEENVARIAAQGAAEQRAADALARVKELEFGAGFEAAFDAVVRPGSRYENWRPADDPAEIVTDLYNDLEDALARAEKAEDWQPIETAKAGELLLLFEPHSMGGFIFVGALNGVWFNNLDQKIQKPTMWRPLPAPPRASREAQPATDGDGNG